MFISCGYDKKHETWRSHAGLYTTAVAVKICFIVLGVYLDEMHVVNLPEILEARKAYR